MTKTMSKSAIEGERAAQNLRHWMALGITDPAHTKKFKRPGGFEGTAIKPIENVRRMTEHFGPCGIGWGMLKPEFQLVPIEGNGEIMVFCTIQLWYDEQGTKATAFGVGGDKVVARGRDGLRTNDESYKSAYTDALSNAMKHIGVAADIHMGRFDDSKYVAETLAAFVGFAGPAPPMNTGYIEMPSNDRTAPEPSGKPVELPLHLQAYNEAAKGSYALRAFWGGLENSERLDICKGLRADPKHGCPASLKVRAEQADEAKASAETERQSSIEFSSTEGVAPSPAN